MGKYMDRLMETDKQRSARLSGAKKKAPAKRKAPVKAKAKAKRKAPSLRGTKRAIAANRSRLKRI